MRNATTPALNDAQQLGLRSLLYPFRIEHFERESEMKRLPSWLGIVAAGVSTQCEGQGVGLARVDAGYVSFEVGDGVEWWMSMHAENSHYAAIKFGPDRSTELEVMPTKDESMEDMVEYMTRKLEAFDEPPEDLGEVTINGLVYHEWASTAPSGKVFLHLATYYEPMGARVQVMTEAAEGTTDFAYPDEVGLMFDTLEFYDGPLDED